MASASEAQVEIIFQLERSIDPLGVAILIAVVCLGHAYGQMPRCQRFHVFTTAVLAASVGMMNRPTIEGKLIDGQSAGL